MAVDAWCECNNSARVRRARTQNMFKLVNLVFVCALLAGRAHCVHADDTDCNTVKQNLQTRGLNNTELLSKPENADKLGVCVVSGKTCCSVMSEEILANYSREQFEKTVGESLVNVSSSFNAESQGVDDFFHKLIADSQRDLNELFNKMFGMIYLKNKYLFTTLYEGFENYYNKGQNLSDTIDTFYRMLSQNIFSDLNPHFTLDNKYLTCAADQMKDLIPFGEVPIKLNGQIKQSFVATRILSKALSVGADVAKNMLSIKPTEECVKSLLRMQHCSSCAGAEAKACPNYCINVMKGCLAYHSSLENEWNNYVEAIDKILDKLLGPFNIVNPVELLGKTIAEGIITYQEKWYDISQKVFTNCGIPTPNRQRRSTSLPSAYSNFHHTRITRDVNTEQSFKNLIRDIKHVVNERKTFWSNLPNQICNTDNMAEEPSKKCWNGTSVNEYLPDVVDDSLTKQKENSDVSVDKNSQNNIPNEQISALRAIVIKLQNAHDGIDVDWIDHEISTTSQPTTVTEKHLPTEATENVFPDKKNATEN